MKQPYIKNIKYLVCGLLVSLAFSFQYSFPALEERDITSSAFINAMSLFAKWINGYGIHWTVAVIGIAYLAFRTEKKCSEKNLVIIWSLAVISVLFGLLNTIGLCMHFKNELPFLEGGIKLFATIPVIFGWSLLFYITALWILWWIEEEKDYRVSWISEKKLFWSSAAIIMAFWLPWIIIFYPASMDNDVFYQLDTVLGYMPKSNHHPWFASKVLTFFYLIGERSGSQNLGIFLFILVRDVLMALIYAKGIVFLKRNGARKITIVLTVLFYSVTPVWGAYAKHAFKDTFAAALFCWFILEISSLIQKEKAGKDSLADWIVTGAAGCVASLFRNNIIYAVVPSAALLIAYIVVCKKKVLKAVILASCISLYFLYNHYIFTYEGVQKGEEVEALSMPFQQTARVVALHHDELSRGEKIAISKFWDYDSIPEKYNPIISDPIKDTFRPVEGVDSKDYLMLWMVMFPEYPREYFEAAFAQSYGYYSFTPKRAYWEGNYNSNMVLFHWIGTLFPSEAFDFHYLKIFDFPRNVLAKWADIWDRLPWLNLTDTIAAYTWMTVLVGWCLLKRRRFAEFIPVVAALFLILTCIASPVNDCFRYFAPVAASVPVIIALVLGTNDNDNNKEYA